MRNWPGHYKGEATDKYRHIGVSIEARSFRNVGALSSRKIPDLGVQSSSHLEQHHSTNFLVVTFFRMTATRSTFSLFALGRKTGKRCGQQTGDQKRTFVFHPNQFQEGIEEAIPQKKDVCANPGCFDSREEWTWMSHMKGPARNKTKTTCNGSSRIFSSGLKASAFPPSFSRYIYLFYYSWQVFYHSKLSCS